MENSTNIFINGSIWLRADFHLHTIQDKEFERIENPNEFIKEYISRLKTEQIAIAVITNHNKFDKEEFSNLYRKAEKENIWVVPGVELSVSDGKNGIHTLIVFDKESWIKDGEDYINQFLTAAFEGIKNRENENARCNYNFENLLEKLSDHKKQGRDSFIVLAHAQQDCGFFHELDGGRIMELSKKAVFKEFVLGIQKIRDFGEIDVYKHWFGGALPVFVEGSDCKKMQDVGKSQTQNGENKKTFIKLGDFNFEALKYALLNAESRVKDKIPKIQNSYIKSIAFDGGKLSGQKINFSPELNNFIGIRGSGKSSIIEIVRYALGISLTQSSEDSNYKNDLIQFVLGSGGKVILNVVDKNNKEYRIEKIYGQKQTIFDENNEILDCEVDAIFDKPVYFGQKDLSNKENNFEMDLLNRLIGGRLRDVHDRISGKKREVQNVILEMQKTQNIDSLKEETETDIRNAEQQLRIFRDNGVAEKLKRQTDFDKDSSILQRNRETFLSYRNELAEVLEKYETFFTDTIPGSTENESIFETATAAVREAGAEFTKIQEILRKTDVALEKYKAVELSLNEKRDEMKEEFAKIKREINSDTLNPDTFLSLTRKIETSKLKLVEINKQSEKRQGLEKQLKEKLRELNELWREEFNCLNEETKKINNTNGNLKIVIEFKEQKTQFIEKLKSVFRGSGLRDSTYQSLSEQFQDFIEIYKTPETVKKIVNENMLGDFNRRFNENLSDLLTFQVENKVTIEYKGKPLDKHSLGQRASALILFLLAQKENDVLIIDQPEDDLDNQTIYDEVIKELLKLKGNMQFIFATHNANIPVLGDSEKIVVCSFEDAEKIALNDGSIDTASVQQDIIRIMEGGQDAFNRRKNIYTIWDKQ